MEKMNELERIERLEDLYEKVYHDYELLSIYIPRLTDILIRYWSASNKHRQSVGNDYHILLDVIKELNKKVHLDKRRPETYTIK